MPTREEEETRRLQLPSISPPTERPARGSGLTLNPLNSPITAGILNARQGKARNEPALAQAVSEAPAPARPAQPAQPVQLPDIASNNPQISPLTGGAPTAPTISAQPIAAQPVVAPTLGQQPAQPSGAAGQLVQPQTIPAGSPLSPPGLGDEDVTIIRGNFTNTGNSSPRGGGFDVTVARPDANGKLVEEGVLPSQLSINQARAATSQVGTADGAEAAANLSRTDPRLANTIQQQVAASAGRSEQATRAANDQALQASRSASAQAEAQAKAAAPRIQVVKDEFGAEVPIIVDPSTGQGKKVSLDTNTAATPSFEDFAETLMSANPELNDLSPSEAKRILQDEYSRTFSGS